MVRAVLIILFSFYFLSVQAEVRGHTNLPKSAGPWVVTVYYDSQSTLADIKQDFDVWEVNTQKKFISVGIYSFEEYQDLLSTGVTAEINKKLMQQYTQPRLIHSVSQRSIPGFSCYRTVEETYAAQDSLVQSYPNLATIIDIGDSWEKVNNANNGYDIRVLKITNSAITGDKPVLYAMGSIHSREYAPAEVATRFGEYLLNNYGSNADATWLVDYHEIHLLMQGNPDGRKVSEGQNFPSQRKNRNANHCASGNRGVDMNRNFEFMWNQGTGSSGNECSDSYRGTSAVSEPENEAINNYIDTIFDDNRGENLSDPAPLTTSGVYIDLHSYSNLILWPYGFSDTSPQSPNHTQLQTLGRRFAWFTGYRPEQSNATLGGADGASDDNAYGRLGVAAYTFEIGSGSEGFYIPCANFENNHYPNNLQALLYAAKSARRPYITPSGPDSIDIQINNSSVSAGTMITLTGVATDVRFSNVNGTEPTQNITAVQAYIDTPPWEAGATAIALNASDGAFDEISENFTGTIDTTGLTQGQHIIYVESTDSTNTAGVVSAIFFDITGGNNLGTLNGQVTDATNSQAIENVTLTLSSGSGSVSAATDITGNYSADVIAGTYNIMVSKFGYENQQINGVNVTANTTTTQNIQLQPLCTLIKDDLEAYSTMQMAESAGWSHGADSAANDDWRVVSGDDHTTGSGVAFVSTDVDSITDKYLISAAVTPGASSQLSFWHKYTFESTENGNYDGGVLEMRVNGGAWQDAAAQILSNGYNGLLSNQHSNPLGGRNAWVGIQAEYIKVEVDLSGQAGNSVQFRWRLGTDSSEAAGDWKIDDIQVSDPGGCQGNSDLIFMNGFESS